MCGCCDCDRCLNPSCIVDERNPRNDTKNSHSKKTKIFLDYESKKIEAEEYQPKYSSRRPYDF